MHETRPHVAPGTMFGAYQVVRLIGEGGMGAVFEAVHTNLKKRVALKTLSLSGAMNADALARFMREGEVAAKIRHPNVVDITDFGIHEGVPYLVMEFLEGENLGSRIARSVLGFTEAVDLLLPVCAAVQAAHDEGVVHRDLKPPNIFLAAGRYGPPSAKLLDFGISKLTDPAKAGPDLTHTQAMLGTPFYMSPEQVRGAKFLDAKTDQYSLGVILYECVTGTLPFSHEQLFSLLTMITVGTHQPISALRADAPPEFSRVVERAMHVDKTQRFETVADLAVALAPFASAGVRAQWEPIFSQRATGVPPVVTPVHLSTSPVVHQARTNASLSLTNPPLNKRSGAWAVGIGAAGLGLAAVVSLKLAGAGHDSASSAAAPPPIVSEVARPAAPPSPEPAAPAIAAAPAPDAAMPAAVAVPTSSGSAAPSSNALASSAIKHRAPVSASSARSAAPPALPAAVSPTSPPPAAAATSTVRQTANKAPILR